MKTKQIKFVIQHHKGTTTIQEVECEEVFCNPWEILSGEKKYKIISLNDPDGKNPIYFSHSVYDSEVFALNEAAKHLRQSMTLWDEKGKETFDEQALMEKVNSIVIKRLDKPNG